MDAVRACCVEARVDAGEVLDVVGREAFLLDYEDLALEHRERLCGRAVVAECVGHDLESPEPDGHDASVFPSHGARVVRRVRAGLDEQHEELLNGLQERRRHVLDRVER